jgi:hypothetical protein
MTNYDCIFIPGGGLLSDGSIPPWTKSRLDKACSLQSQTQWLGILSGGTVHKPPPLTKDGYPIFESRAAGSYLISNGVDPKKILMEISSYDTIGNAYFSRMLFVDPMQMEKLLIITSDFHLLRAQSIFNWVYKLPPQTDTLDINYESVPDQGLSSAGLKARKERERSSLEKIRITQEKITSFQAFHTWFYREHRAYAASQSDPENIPTDLLESY